MACAPACAPRRRRRTLGLGHRHREHLADVAAAEVVFQHRCLEPLPLALLAGGDAGHHRQVGVDDAGAVAVGAGALGVGAEQRRLHAVGLRERLADRVEQSGVGRRVAPSRAADRALVDRHHPAPAGIDPCTSELLPEPATPVTTRAPRAGCRRRRLQVVVVAPRISSVPVGVRTVSLRAARSSRWRPVMVPLARSPRRCPRSRRCRPPYRRRGRGRRRGRRSRSSPARAPRRAPCCPCPAAAAAGRSSARRHGGAGRSWARRRRR